MAKAKIIGTGAYAPGERISNDEIRRLAGVEFDEEQVAEVRGIRGRHFARLRGLDESTADFAEKAARAAMADAGVAASDPSLFVVATDTPEYISPPTSMLVQGRIQGGQADAETLDVNASCAGFVTAFDLAAKLLAAEPSYRYAVVVGAYCMSAHIRPGDAFGWGSSATEPGPSSSSESPTTTRRATWPAASYRTVPSGTTSACTPAAPGSR
ncbi:MAG TPA: hypothetical protein PLH55_05415 [Spirochaetales bacterium]|nr:hypothetical protein [Spirochaetales bacterium]